MIEPQRFVPFTRRLQLIDMQVLYRGTAGQRPRSILDDDQPRLRILDLPRDLARREPDIERHNRRPKPEQRMRQDCGVRLIVKEGCHPIPFSYAERGKFSSDFRRGSVELRICEALPTATERCAVWIARCACGEPVGERRHRRCHSLPERRPDCEQQAKSEQQLPASLEHGIQVTT